MAVLLGLQNYREEINTVLRETGVGELVDRKRVEVAGVQFRYYSERMIASKARIPDMQSYIGGNPIGNPQQAKGVPVPDCIVDNLPAKPLIPDPDSVESPYRGRVDQWGEYPQSLIHAQERGPLFIIHPRPSQ